MAEIHVREGACVQRIVEKTDGTRTISLGSVR